MTLGLIIIILALGIALFIVLNQSKKTKTKLNVEIQNKDSELSTKTEQNSKLNSDLVRFSGIISIENEIESKNKEFSEIQANATELNDRYINAKSIFKELEKDIKLYQNDLEFVELGIYEPIFDLDTSEKYKERITQIVARQKQLIKGGNACVCNTEWVVGNSRKQGEIMTRRYINLTLRAFNGECDALISKVRWNNIRRFEERITKAFNAINKLGQSNNTSITDKYLKLKLDELHLVYELAHKKYQEKEEARAIREEQREEERAQREFEKARKDAEMEEKRFQKALERARKDLGLVSGEKLEELNSQIAQLEQNLKEAHEAKERAISRAQETKSGHVYIISNLGSFGENVYKIGMTRRLEPMDRVKELGDASVPFTFDLHAMIFSENAPELENLLHREFDDRRINKVNYRKEYFRVTLDEIEQVIINKYEKEVDFIKDIEAQQFRETKSIIKQLQQAKEEQGENEIEKYPESLF
ncbi:DUF4041 domain-containing protein [Ulvibacter litoralis]|uniref:Meiotically up-regulated gene 113 n=1 Tax=Ulvibacter litoralis TaxID=227084 RepID=A0A1G7IIW1_9FLAO|nr:DUF4041 domain-containing protein [Ulvibacter litoralis]GHC60985.1 chromosome segregation ATPase [Ulvibacter litoralis]SDF12690.1 Meiotically up-regulated gene 113 [Ulvibacter litoralis]